MHVLSRLISDSLKRLIARDVRKTRETPVEPGPSLLNSDQRFPSPPADAGWIVENGESLLGPIKRTRRLEWCLQGGADCWGPRGLEKRTPQRHGCPDRKLTDDAREKRASLLVALSQRQGTLWSWPSDFLDQRLVFPENMSQPHRIEFTRIYDATRHSRQTEMAIVKAGCADMCSDAQGRMNAAHLERDVVEAGGKHELETLATLSQ